MREHDRPSGFEWAVLGAVMAGIMVILGDVTLEGTFVVIVVLALSLAITWFILRKIGR